MRKAALLAAFLFFFFLHYNKINISIHAPARGATFITTFILLLI